MKKKNYSDMTITELQEYTKTLIDELTGIFQLCKSFSSLASNISAILPSNVLYSSEGLVTPPPRTYSSPSPMEENLVEYGQMDSISTVRVLDP